MSSFERSTNFEVYTCCHAGCGVQFAMTSCFVGYRRGDKKWFYCPAGHHQFFPGETPEQKRLRDLSKKAEELELSVRAADARAVKAEANATQVNKQYLKMRHRIRKGMCPCCSEVFQNLAQHMSAKHPEFGSRELVRELREAFGLTQGSLGKEIGIAGAMISLYETGKSVSGFSKRKIEEWLSRQVTA